MPQPQPQQDHGPLADRLDTLFTVARIESGRTANRQPEPKPPGKFGRWLRQFGIAAAFTQYRRAERYWQQLAEVQHELDEATRLIEIERAARAVAEECACERWDDPIDPALAAERIEAAEGRALVAEANRDQWHGKADRYRDEAEAAEKRWAHAAGQVDRMLDQLRDAGRREESLKAEKAAIESERDGLAADYAALSSDHVALNARVGGLLDRVTFAEKRCELPPVELAGVREKFMPDDARDN